MGFLRHLVADMANPSLRMLWWPLSRRMIHPRWLPAVREATPAGHWVEHGAVLMALIGALALWGARWG